VVLWPSRTEFGWDVYPSPNGHFLIAYELLKALSCEGDIGAIPSPTGLAGPSVGAGGGRILPEGIAAVLAVAAWNTGRAAPAAAAGAAHGSVAADGIAGQLNAAVGGIQPAAQRGPASAASAGREVGGAVPTGPALPAQGLVGEQSAVLDHKRGRGAAVKRIEGNAAANTCPSGSPRLARVPGRTRSALGLVVADVHVVQGDSAGIGVEKQAAANPCKDRGIRPSQAIDDRQIVEEDVDAAAVLDVEDAASVVAADGDSGVPVAAGQAIDGQALVNEQFAGRQRESAARQVVGELDGVAAVGGRDLAAQRAVPRVIVAAVAEVG